MRSMVERNALPTIGYVCKVTFAKAIGIILSGLTYDICLCYFDDDMFMLF